MQLKQVLNTSFPRQGDGLVRLTGLLHRRGYTLESLSVFPETGADSLLVTAVGSGPQGPHQLLSVVSKLVDARRTRVSPAGQGAACSHCFQS